MDNDKNSGVIVRAVTYNFLIFSARERNGCVLLMTMSTMNFLLFLNCSTLDRAGR